MGVELLDFSHRIPLSSVPDSSPFLIIGIGKFSYSQESLELHPYLIAEGFLKSHKKCDCKVYQWVSNMTSIFFLFLI